MGSGGWGGLYNHTPYLSTYGPPTDACANHTRVSSNMYGTFFKKKDSYMGVIMGPYMGVKFFPPSSSNNTNNNSHWDHSMTCRPSAPGKNMIER